MVQGRKITAKQRDRFLAVLAEYDCATWAPAASGVARQSFYRLRQRDNAFAAAWAEAVELNIGALEDEAMRRAWKVGNIQSFRAKVGTVRALL